VVRPGKALRLARAHARGVDHGRRCAGARAVASAGRDLDVRLPALDELEVAELDPGERRGLPHRDAQTGRRAAEALEAERLQSLSERLLGR
jgi:hypothetical protein